MKTARKPNRLQLSLLNYLDANPTRYGLTTSLLLRIARNQGHPKLQLDQVEAEIRVLEEKKLVVKVPAAESPGVLAWRISAQGRDLVEV